MPARDYSIYTGFRRGGAPEYQITGMRRGGGVEIPVAPSTPPLGTAPIAQPTMVIPANAATFQTATGWTIPTGVTVDTTGNGRAVVDGTGTTRNIDRTIPAMDTGKTYAVTVGFANKVAGRNQLSFLGGTTATLMSNGYLTGHRTARFTPASAHTSMRIGLFSESGNPQMDVIDAQIADITAMLANPRAIFIDAGQSNAAGAFARTGFDPELDKPELRCLAVPSRTTTTLNCVTDGTGASYGTALGALNGIGTPQPMTTPLAHVTAVATDATVTPAVMPALAASRHMCDHWPYPGYTPTMILSGAAQASLFNAAHWDFEASPAGGYYRLMRAQIDAQLAAVPGSFVAGFFWQQGEADSGNLEYNAKFTRMIAELRAAYGDFPVIIREIGGLLTAGNTAAFIERQKRLASNSGHVDALSRCSYVGRPVGIADNLLLEDEAGSWIHYRADTSRTMGEDGGEAMVAQLVRRPVPGAVAAPANTVAPVLSGSTTPGSTLTTTAGTFTGGTGALTYQTRWQRSTDSGVTWAVIAGQTALTYVTTGEADGTHIRAQRQATDTAALTSGWASSNVITMAAAASVPVNTALPTTSGGTTVGATRTITSGTWTNSPTSYQSRWQRSTDGGTTWAIAQGVDGTLRGYTHVAGDAGALIRCQVQAFNGAGASVYASTTTYTVTAAAATAPANTTAPVVSGGTAVGDTLIHASDVWTGTAPITYTYVWERSVALGAWTPISGATSATYTLVSADGGNRVRLVKTGTNSAGNASATSNIITVEAEGGSVIANTLTNPPISARLGIINERSARPFVNAFKQAWEWEGNNLGGNWASLRSAGHISAGGQIVSMPSGSDAGIRTRALDSLIAESGATGRWRLTWTGAGAFDVFGASNEDYATNSIEFDYTANGGSWITVVARSAPISNIALVHEDDWADHAAGRNFRDQYLEEVRNYRTLRFDEWTGILRDEPYGLAVTTWASRPLPTDETFQNRFVPLEWQAELCNLVGADLWVCAPTAATADYDTGAATLIQSLMQAPRRVYAEYSTKTWDFAGTPQAHYCAEQGRIAFGTTANPTEQEFRSWYGMRSALMAQRWRAVWGSNTRLVTVIQHQADWVGGEYDVLVAPMWQERDGTLGLPAYVAPHSVCDMLTVHAQIDGGMAYGSAASLLETWRTTLTQTEAFNRIRDQMLTGPYHAVGDDGRRTVQLLTPKWQHYRTVANTYGLELAAYEVGNHLNGVGGSADLRAFMHLFSVSAQMGEVYTATFAAIRAAGFDGPLCMSVECRLPDDNIMHGLQRWLGDHNAAWTAVNAINLANDGPTGRSASDFVGTMEVA